MRWDVFISYAHADGERLAKPLGLALHERNITVWLDDDRLHPGDELTAGLVRAIGDARFVVPIFTPRYFERTWTIRELAGFVATHRHRIIPVLDSSLPTTVLGRSPVLEDLVALSVPGDAGLDAVATRIAQVVREGSLPVAFDPPEAAKLSDIRARHWIRVPAGVAEELSSLFPQPADVLAVLGDARAMLTTRLQWKDPDGDDPRVLRPAHLPLGSGALVVWDVALNEAARRDPRMLAALVIAARARAQRKTSRTTELLETIESAETP